MRVLRRFSGLFSRAWRPVVAFVSLGCILLGTIGFPVVRPRGDAGGTPFPCQHHACGCQSAAACWKNCCCFTREQKLAWAAQRGIVPPLSAAAPLAQKESSSSCCARGLLAACTSQPRPKAGGESRAAGARQTTHPSNPPLENQVEIAVGALAQHCQGLPLLWTILGGALPPVQFGLRFSLDPGEWLRVESAAAAACSSSPEVPPPRMFVS
jgi:hypothetical protein